VKSMETNDWLVLNSIIYKIYTTKELDGMRETLLEQLKLVLDFDSADFFLAGEKELSLISPVTYNCESVNSALYDELDYSRGIMYSGKSMVYRETDIISDEKRAVTEYYQKVYRPNNWHFSIQMILARDKQFLGVITLYRTIGKDNFQYEDIFLLDMLKDHLSFRLFQEREKNADTMEKVSVRVAVERYQLTKREETILKLLMEGADNVAICEHLVISINTLKKHILNIYRKLGIRNRVQLFKLVREHEE